MLCFDISVEEVEKVEGRLPRLWDIRVRVGVRRNGQLWRLLYWCRTSKGAKARALGESLEPVDLSPWDRYPLLSPGAAIAVSSLLQGLDEQTQAHIRTGSLFAVQLLACTSETSRLSAVVVVSTHIGRG